MNFIMKKWKIRFYFPIVLLAGLIASQNSEAQPALENNLLAGTSKIMITPQTPIPMSGYGSRAEAFKGIHDNLFARVIVFSDGAEKAVLISAEILGFTHPFWEEITKRITKETGIKKEFVLLAAVHNHGGPVTRVNEKTSSEVLAYIEELMGKLIIATKEASNNRIPVSIGEGKGECRMNINRRAPDGKGGIALGRNPYSNTFMLTHCNGSSGYLITEDAYPVAGVSGYEDKSVPKGGYETNVTKVKTGAEKALIKNLLKMINDL
jgi:hypothetical protein